ncbi:MAG: AAA family ATPase [Chlamydiae bacterium]|nr:AAA family ATPase [Chlamydiota bacterium]
MPTWELFLQALSTELGDEAVKTWLHPLKVIHFDAGNLYLEASTPFQVEWFEEHVRQKAIRSFVNPNSRPIKIHLTCSAMPSTPSHKKDKTPAPLPPLDLQGDPLMPEYTWDRFLFGEEGEVIERLLMQALHREPTLCYPFMLYGPNSSGKTHLLQAFTKKLQEQQVNVLYVRAETFTEHVVKAIRTGRMQDFRKAYRHLQVLVLDDVHNLAGKSATQEEFFHTFNTLHSLHRLILLSADKAPSLLEGIEPRLISRLEWGLVLPLAKLRKEELYILAKKQASQLDVLLTDSALDFLIDKFSSSPHSLQQAMQALYMRTPHTKNPAPLSSISVESLLKDILEQEQGTRLSIENILQEVALFYELTPQEILHKSQTKEYSQARQMAMFLCRTLLDMPFKQIGKFFQRDHSTVMTSVRNIEERISSEGETKTSYTKIRQKLGV